MVANNTEKIPSVIKSSQFSYVLYETMASSIFSLSEDSLLKLLNTTVTNVDVTVFKKRSESELVVDSSTISHIGMVNMYKPNTTALFKPTHAEMIIKGWNQSAMAPMLKILRSCNSTTPPLHCSQQIQEDSVVDASDNGKTTFINSQLHNIYSSKGIMRISNDEELTIEASNLTNFLGDNGISAVNNLRAVIVLNASRFQNGLTDSGFINILHGHLVSKGSVFANIYSRTEANLLSLDGCVTQLTSSEFSNSDGILSNETQAF